MFKQIVYPVLHYDDVNTAADWLCRVFQFKMEMKVGAPDAVVFAIVKFGGASIMLSSSTQGLPLASPRSVGACTAAIHVNVAELGSHYQKAQAEGAEIVRPLEKSDHGTRDYNVVDLEGHVWNFSDYAP